MAEPKLTDATKGPLRRPLTILAITAAALSMIMMIGVLLAAFNVLPSSLTATFVVIWMGTLFLVFVITRLLRSDPPDSGRSPRE